MGFYYFDYTYFLFMVPALIITMVAQFRVKSVFGRYSRVGTIRRITGAQAADAVARSSGALGVAVRQIGGSLTDNYDPRTNTISLSQDVYAAFSVAAVGVAAHEAGHAVQQAEGYWPNRIRAALVPVTNFSARLATPLILIGLILPTRFDCVVYAGIALFSLAVLFQLVTLPVEFDASRRAVEALGETGILYSDELDGARRVLKAAAMTYLAASFASILALLRLLLIAGNRRGRD